MISTNDLVRSPRVIQLYHRLVADGTRTRGTIQRADGSWALRVTDTRGRHVGNSGRFRERAVASGVHFALCRLHTLAVNGVDVGLPAEPKAAVVEEPAASKLLAPRAAMPGPAALATARAKLEELATSVVGTTKLAEGNYALRLANGNFGPGFTTRSLATRVWKALVA